MMCCYAVYFKDTNKQIKVYSYDSLIVGDSTRAFKAAKSFADLNELNGYHCIIENFHLLPDIGTIVYDTTIDSLK